MNTLKCILGFGLLSLLYLTAPVAEGLEVTGIAAKVNGRVITKNEVNFHLAPIKQQINASMPRKNGQYYTILKEAKSQILNDLIERELILSEFNTLTQGNGISANAIDEEINRQIADNFNNNRSEFNKALKEAGLTPEQNRREVEKKLIVQAMRSQQFRNSIPPLPDEISSEYHNHKRKMRDTTGDSLEFHKIYIKKTDPQNLMIQPETQLELAENIVSELNQGADFGELAIKHSADAYAKDGGNAGLTKRTDLSPSFAAILMETPEKTILGPLEDPYGYTIVRIDKKHYGPAPALSKVRNVIENRVRARNNKSKLDKWIKRLRDNAMIEIK
ncbi:MAG: peptidylprolyl isomerase [Akkermansiaceae bacterium]